MSVSLCTDMHILKKSRAFENVIVDIRFESTRIKYKYTHVVFMSACVSDNTEVDQESTITQRVSLYTDLLMSRERISWNIRHLQDFDF